MAKKYMSDDQFLKLLEEREMSRNEILFYNYQIYTNFRSLKIPSVSEDAVLKNKKKRETKSFLFQGPKTLTKI